MYDSLINVSYNGLFQLSGATSYLFTTSIWQATKICMLPTALGFPEDMSHRSKFGIGDPKFSLRVAPVIKAFC